MQQQMQGAGGSSNQWYSSMPSLPQGGMQTEGGQPGFNVSALSNPYSVPPGVVPPSGGLPSYSGGLIAPNGLPSSMSGAGSQQGQTGLTPYTHDIGGGNRAGMPLDPSLTSQLFNMLQGQIGQGVSPFNLSAILPGGGTTAPGTLTAPADPIVQQLMSFFQTGNTSVPGLNTLNSMSQTGNPTDVGPAWQSMVAAMGQNTNENLANLKEQFNLGGNLAGSPYGQAVSDYMTQTNTQQNALLGQMQQQASEAAAGRQLTAGTTLAGEQANLGSFMQNLDQTSIQNLYNEFVRTSPQNNPLLSMMYGAGTTFPAFLGNKTSTSPIAGALQLGGALAGGAQAGLGASAAGGSTISSILAGLAAL